MGVFNLLKKIVSTDQTQMEDKNADRTLKKESFNVVGAYYYEDNIMKLAVSNPDWKKNKATLKKECGLPLRIYRYTFISKPVKLIPEPTNKYDKNAVQVVIAGELVGHVPADLAVHIKKVISSHDVKYISAFIDGGDYKVVKEDETFKAGDGISIKISIGYV